MKGACSTLMAALVMLAFVGWDTGKAHAQTIKLTYSCHFPPRHTHAKLASAWCKEVEARTKGRVKIELLPGLTSITPEKIYEDVVNGAFGVAQSVFSDPPGRFPVMSTIGLPLGYTSGKIATGVANEVYRHFKPKEMSDTEVMYVHAHGPAFIHTRGKAVRKLEDIKGLKLRSQGIGELIVRQLGGIPKSSAVGEVYVMIQKGMVAGATHPYNANVGFKWGELYNYATATYSVAYTLPMFVVMNKDKWKALPEDIKVIIREINNEWIPQHGEAWDAYDTEGMRFLLDNGGQIIGLDKNEATRWKMAVAPIIEDYVKTLDKMGLNGRETVDFTAKTLNSMQ